MPPESTQAMLPPPAPDLDQIDYRGPDGIAAGARLADPRVGLGADLVLLGDPGLAVHDEADLGRGAAHVERDRVRVAQLARDVVGDDHPGGRARLHHVGRLLGAGLEGQHPAARLHDEQLRGHAAAAEPAFDILQVAGQDRTDARIDDGGAGAEVLPELRAYLGRERDDEILAVGAQQLADTLLVDRVQIAVEQADRDRDDIVLGQRPCDLVDPGLVKGLQHPAPRIQPLLDLEAEIARHQRGRLFEVDVVERRPDLSADLQHVAEALGRDERGARGLAFDQRVGGDGGAVHQVGNGVRSDVSIRQDALDRVEESAGGIGGRRGDLRDSGRSACFREENGIGERATDVHPEAKPIAHDGSACVNSAWSSLRRALVRAASIEPSFASITTP